ncbi:MarR family transcriptional regulator [Bacteroides acidifaciens]|uniref:MarR family transcriptional regulator n=1 Tax=Bacteroides acidifaciens TaxID=85831 RepID=UPI002571280E|nr:helix-turn-helix domain-containing protein [Bacteroides acidifaciens]
MKEITIAGQQIELRNLSKQDQKGLWLELIANFKMMQFDFNGQVMLLLVAKGEMDYTNVQRRKISERIESIKHIPAVFYFDNLLTYERDRLVEQGVYFIVADKFAFVPTLIINRLSTKSEIKELFYPSTQYILLYHLQIESLDGLSLKELEDKVPYKYKTIAKSIKQLEALGLVRLEGSRNKKLVFELSGKELWDKASTNLIDPIKSIEYTSDVFPEGDIGGISALSHYSMLAPEDVPTRVLTAEWVREHKYSIPELHSFEDTQRIEIWKYPPSGTSGYVDKLSLFLTLKDDNDPRVEKEIAIMMNKIKW